MGNKAPTPRKRGSVTTPKPPLHLRENEEVAKGLLRLAALQCSAAVKILKKHGISEEAVHQARTLGKKSRALLQLCSPSLRGKTRDSLMSLIAKASGRLSRVRDADVLLESFDRILLIQTDIPNEGHRSQGFHVLRAGIADASRQRRSNDRKLIPGTIRLLNGCLQAIGAAGHTEMDGRQLRRRVRRTYRKGRLMLDACCEEETPETFHSWRKMVKQLWYQLRITSRRWPDHASELIRIAGSIGDLAGWERDLTLLDEFLKNGIENPESREIRAMIRKEREKLRESCLKMGTTLFAPTPRDFAAPMKVEEEV